MQAVDSARSTTSAYLAELIAAECPRKIDRWVPPETYALIERAARRFGTTPMRPIFEALGERIPYDVIRLVTSHLNAVGGA